MPRFSTIGGLGRAHAWETGGVLDERWIRSLHVEALREEDLHAGQEAHVLFQASTIGALLEGAYEGDLSFAELAEQGVFELRDVVGTMLGFRFPDHAEGIEVAGYHLHFIGEDRRRGGHVLGSCSRGDLRVRLDPSDDLHVELPPGIELADPILAAATHAAVERTG